MMQGREIYTLSKRQLDPQKLTHESDQSEEEYRELRNQQHYEDGESGAELMFKRDESDQQAITAPLQASCGESLMLQDVPDSNQSSL